MLMPNVICAISAGTVQVTTSSLIDVSDVPTPASVGIRFLIDGREQTFEGDGQPYSTTGLWLLQGANSDYDFRYDPTGATLDPGSSPINSWLPANSTIRWELTRSVIGNSNVTGPLRIRRRADLRILVDQTLTLDVTLEQPI